MTVLNVAIIGSDELSREIAKHSDSRDVDTYVHKEAHEGGCRIISLIRPVKFPERLRPLLSALNAARAGIIEVKTVDSTIGEALIAFASAGIEEGIVVINPPSGEWVDEEQIIMLLKQAGLNWKIIPPDGIELRSELFSIMDKLKSSLAESEVSPLVVPIDQNFNVKGIGLVAIGYVQSGRVAVHDEILILPSGGGGIAKSLQVMDDDVEVASAGDRVGIALRNAKEELLSASSIIVHPPVDEKNTSDGKNLAIIAHENTTFKLIKSPFQKRELSKGDVVHVAVDLQFIVGRVESVADDMISVKWDSPLYIRSNSPPPALICQLDFKPRIMGQAIDFTVNSDS